MSTRLMNANNDSGFIAEPGLLPENSMTFTGSEFPEGTVQENNIKISLVPSRRKKIRKVNVIIEGQFNIGNAQLVKENCRKLLLHFDFVSITLKNIVDIDLAAIQLLHVLKATPELSQKTITSLILSESSIINTFFIIFLNGFYFDNISIKPDVLNSNRSSFDNSESIVIVFCDNSGVAFNT